MSLRELFRRDGEGPSLYRRAWSKTDDPLVAEARSQTLAIQRLEVWLRLAYSALAGAALLTYWGFAGDGSTTFGVVGVLVAALSFACVVVLRTGIAHGRRNVMAMLDELEQRKDERSP